MSETIKHLAEISGAKLASALPSTRLISFVVLRSGEVEVTLADGSVFVIARRCDASDLQGLAAEEFISMMSNYATLPIGERPEGRRFFRRTIIGANGKPYDRFSEAGRDV